MSERGERSDAVAIVGMGCRLPGSPDLTALRRTVREGRVPVREVPPERWDHTAFYDPNPRRLDRSYVKRLASVDDIDQFCPEYYGILPRRARFMDPQQRLLLEAARAAIEDAGLLPAALGARRTGVFVGISVAEHYQLTTARLSVGAMREGAYGRMTPGLEEVLDLAIENVPPLQAHSMVGQMLNMCAANVAQAFDLRGPAFAVDSACSSALVALGEAILHLRAGSCDAALVGGVYLACTPNNLVAFSRIGALSRAEVCRPFDEEADGFVLGEGAGCVLLKRLDDALAHGDRIWAVVRGFGANNDGRGEGPMTPRLEGQVAAVEQGYADAGIAPAQVGLIEAHGTATRVGDLVEATALAQVFGPARRGVSDAPPCLVSSIKGNIGHTLAGAGAAGLLNAALAVADGVVPPLAGHARARGELPLRDAGLEIPDRARAWESAGPRVAAVSSFGFGGTNVHVVLEQAPAPGRASRRAAAGAPGPRVVDAAAPSPELFVLSAPSAPLLARYARLVAAEVAGGSLPLADVAYTLSRRRLDPVRAAVVAGSAEALVAGFEQVARRAEGDPGVDAAEDSGPGEAGARVWLHTGEDPLAPEELAFLFPGQGAQGPDLCRDLRDRFPAFAARLEALAAAADPVLGRSLLAVLHPSDEEARSRAGDELRQTALTQPALAAVELALAGFLGELGVEPGLALGHSLGEFVAAAAGGAMDANEAVRLVARRGQLMAELPGHGGVMVALAADRETAARLLEGVDGAVLANINHPRQVVASGTAAAIDRVVERAGAAGVRTTRLAVSHAFHSPLVAPAADRFRAELERAQLAAPARPVLSCAAAPEVGPLGESAEEVRERLARHATATIDFAAGVRAAWQAGARAFLQVGAGSALLSMVRAQLAEDGAAPRLAVAAAPDRALDGAGLLEALGALVAAGVPVRTGALFAGRPVELVALPTTPLETRPLWLLRAPAEQPPLPEVIVGAPERATGAGEPPEPRGSGSHTGSPLPLESQMSVPEEPADPARPRPAPDQELLDLFQRQLDLMHAQVAVLQGRGAALPARAVRATAEATAAAVMATTPRTASAAGEPAGAAASAGDAGAASGPAPAAGGGGRAPDRATLEQQVLQLVARVSALPPASVAPRSRLGSDLGLDSIMVVELGAAIQESFGLVELPEDLIGRDASVSELVDQLAALLAGKPGGSAAAATPRDHAPSIERHRAGWRPAPLPAEAAPRPAFDGGAVVLADRAGVAGALAGGLRAAGREVLLVDPGPPDAAPGTGAPAFTWPAGADLLIDLTGLDADPARALDPSSIAAPVRRALAAIHAARDAGVRPGYLAAAVGPAAAAAAGLARALAAEWPDRIARAAELAGATDARGAAEQLWRELTTGDRLPEVRLAAGTREAMAIEPAPLDGRARDGIADGQPPRLDLATAIVSGGAGGVGAALAEGLAAAGVRDLVLLGRRAPGPDTERVIAAIAAAGGRARYLACDVSDEPAVRRALDAVRGELGPVELVVHAAGQTADGPVEDTPAEAIDAVFGGKVAGALALWRACAADPLRGFVALGSWAGRFGNRHQSIYAAANRALAGLTDHLAAERPAVAVAAIDLPPWIGGGMADRLPEAVRSAMRARGVPFLDHERGVPLVLAEIAGLSAGAHQVVVGAGPRGAGARHRARLFLDPASPWLEDHRVAGARRLPLAAALDLALAGAGRVGLDLASGPVTLRDVRVHAPVEVPDRGAAIAVEARADSSGSAADLELWVEPPDGRGAARLAVSLRAERAADELAAIARPGGGERPRLELDLFYAEHTFHGPRMRGVVRVDEVGPGHARGAVRTAPAGWPRAGLDVLGIDGALQLAGFFARERLGRFALPVSVSECRVLAPLPAGASLECLVVLEEAGPGMLRGHIDLAGPNGDALVQLRGLEARALELAEARGAAASPESASADGRAGNGHAGNGHAGNGSAAGDHRDARPIDPATYRIDQFPELVELGQRRAMVAALGLRNPYFNLHEQVTNERSIIEGAEYLNYSSYNYLGLSGHPEVNRAVQRAVDRYGTSVSASRVASGEKPLHRELERALADLLGCEDAIVLVSGHATNVSVIGHMFDQRDVILHDSLAHDSILGGARLSGARRRPFPHNDVDALEELLEQIRPHARRVLIAVEGVYSMDGDLAPLARIIELKKRYGALLLVDEAHSLGVIGRTGRGIGEHAEVDRADVDLWMGTLSKSLASCGGYIAGSAALVDYLKYTNPGFVYSVGISPANAAAALAACEIMLREPERVATLQARSRYFLDRLRERGIDTGMSSGSAVVPAIVPSSLDCLRLAQALHDRGINVQPILYPAVEEDMARLRFFVTSGHSEADLSATADAVREELVAINPRHLRQAPAPWTGASRAATASHREIR